MEDKLAQSFAKFEFFSRGRVCKGNLEMGIAQEDFLAVVVVAVFN